MKIILKKRPAKKLRQARLVSTQRQDQLDKSQFIKLGANCNECPFAQQHSLPTIHGENKKYMFCGDYPRDEDSYHNGLDKSIAGKQWQRVVFDHLSLAKEDVGYTNLIACVRPNIRKLNKGDLDKAIECCAPRLSKDLEGYNHIISMGESAFTTLVGADIDELGGLSKVHGQYYNNKILATYNFNYGVNTNPAIITVIEKDLLRLQVGPNKVPDVNKVIIKSESQLSELVSKINARPDMSVVIDLETSHLDRLHSKPDIWWEQTILAVGICYEPGTAYIVPEELIMSVGALNIIRPLLARQNLIGANFKFDALIFKGVYYRYFNEAPRIHIHEDTWIMSYVLDEEPGRHSLKEHASWYDDRGYDDVINDYITNKVDSYSQVPTDKLYTYLAKDVDYTLRFYTVLKQRLLDSGQYQLPYRDILLRAQNKFIEIEYMGAFTATEKVESASLEVTPIVDRLLKEIKQIAGDYFNPNSPQQIAKFLYDDHNLPYPKSGKGKPATHKKAVKEILTFLEDEDVETCPPKALLIVLGKYRTMFKLLTTYINKLLFFMDEKKWSHHGFNLAKTVTGRISGGIFMTLPADAYGSPLIRGCFRAPISVDDLRDEYQKVVNAYVESIGGPDKVQPLRSIDVKKDNPKKYEPGQPDELHIIERPGAFVMLDADFSQAEVRGAGFLSQDSAIIKVYEDDEDIHGIVSEQSFGPGWGKDERRVAKRVVFGSMYGATIETLVSQGIPRQVAEMTFNRFIAWAWQYDAWRKDQFAQLKEYGVIYTPTRRMRRIPYINKRTEYHVINQAYNFGVQSFANDIALVAICEIDDFFRSQNLPIWPVIYLHDGLYFYCFNHKPLIDYAKEHILRIMNETALKMQQLEYGQYINMKTVPYKADMTIRVFWG